MKKLMNKKVNLFGKGIPVFVIAILGMALVTAALLPYFGKITGLVTVTGQGLLVDGLSMPASDSIEDTYEDFTSLEAKTFVTLHNLTNEADVDAVVNLDDACSPSSSPHSCNEINVSYYNLTGYSEEFLAEDTHFNNTNITVEDLGDSILWTLEVPQNAVYGTGRGSGGQVVWSVSIGVGNEILYQVHNNDGTDHSFDFGTYLYSEYDNGWHTGSDNTLVSEMEGIEATGEYIDGEIFTIEIDKSRLDTEEFKWVVYANYETDALPEDFSWSDTNTTNFKTAEVGTELTNPITVPTGETIDFAIVTEFPQMTYPGDYNITTKVNLAE
jgi:hypothetical protein